MFPKGKFNTDISWNTQYMALFRSPSHRKQIKLRSGDPSSLLFGRRKKNTPDSKLRIFAERLLNRNRPRSPYFGKERLV